MTSVNILILEDEALIALDIEMTLAAAGYDQIEVCNSVDAALKQISDARPDIALLDLNLGSGTTSIPVATRLNDLGCPFLFLSGYTRGTVPIPEEFDTMERLQKPFNETELISAVGRLTEGNSDDHQ